MSNSEEKTIKGNFNIRDVELLLHNNVDTGECVDRNGVDKTREYIDSNDDKSIAFLLILFPRFRHYFAIIYSTKSDSSFDGIFNSFSAILFSKFLLRS